MEWVYVVKQPIFSVLTQLKAKVDVGAQYENIGPERLTNIGQVNIARPMPDRHQVIQLNAGRYSITRNNTGGTSIDIVRDKSYTTITITESALIRRAVPNDWPAAAKTEFKRPGISDIALPSFKLSPANWGASMTPIGASQYWASFVDNRPFAVIESEIDAELVVKRKWSKSSGIPNTTYRPKTQSESQIGIVYITLDQIGSSKDPKVCSVSISYVARGSTMKHPHTETLYRVFD
jgi:hypothetical protein